MRKIGDAVPSLISTVVLGLVFVSNVYAGQPFLISPIQGYTPFTIPISSVFDHSLTTPYIENGEVVAYTAERGSRNASLDCYAQQNDQSFTVNGHYVGTRATGSSIRLCYDGHPGYDFPFGTGTPVYAAALGTVVCVSVGERLENTTQCTYGQGLGEIKIDHGNGYFTIYLHLSAAEVHADDRVTGGQTIIGRSGETGAPDAPHLHFEVRRNIGGVLVPVDPYGWQGGGPDPYTRTANVNLWLLECATKTFWGFDTNNDRECWTPFHVESSAVLNGIFSIDPTASDPYITSPPLALDSRLYDTVQIQMASNAPDGNGVIYFTTADEPGYGEDKQIPFAVTNDGQYRTYNINMRAHAKWQGTITGIRLDPAGGGLEGTNRDTIGIDYVTLRSSTLPHLTPTLNQSNFQPGDTLVLTAVVTPGVTPRTVDAYVAIQVPSCPDFSCLIFWLGGFNFTQVPLPVVRNWIVAPFDGEIFRYTFNGGEQSGSYKWLTAFTEPGTGNIIGGIAEAPFTFSALPQPAPTLVIATNASGPWSKIASGPQGTTFYFQGSGFTPNSTGTQHISRPDGSELTASIGIDSNGNLAWSYTSTCTDQLGTYTISVVDESTGESSNDVTESQTVNPDCTPPPTLLCDGSTACRHQQLETFTFTGENYTPSGNVTRHLLFPDGHEEILTAITADSHGNIGWAFTPVCTSPTGTYTLWAVDDTTGEKSNDVSETITANPSCAPIIWEFNTDGNAEGWAFTNITSRAVQGGSLFIDPAGSDPYISGPTIAANATALRRVTLRMASNALDGNGAIYFRTLAENDYSDDKRVPFTVSNCSLCGNASWNAYTIEMGTHPKWTGTITGIRLDPADRGQGGTNLDTIGIDYIRLVP